MKKITQAWLDAAQDDLRAIERLVEDEALTNIIAFHAQQCVEKSFKALVEEIGVPVRRTHSLVQLLGVVSKAYDRLSDMDTTLLNVLDQLYTDSRYPNEFGLLPNGKPSLEEAGLFQQFATEMHHRCSGLLRP
jgi:HEPN domain-containing protein